MVVRRNDRRRRLINDEFVPTVGNIHSALRGTTPASSEGSTTTRRAYASGADRRNQLRTTDIFPKRTWLIVALGLLLLLVVASVNLLALYAESWRFLIGAQGVAALQLRGAGTLASWFLCFMMLLAAAASWQIYSLRRHRCDDYVGTYRMWVWFPPLFLVASMGTLIDFGSIFQNMLLWAGVSFPSQSWVPLWIGWVVLAVIAGRVLYEVRESKAAAVMLSIAWLTGAVALAAQSPAASRLASGLDLPLIVGNSHLVFAWSILIAKLFYIRYVYLHAHGLIVAKRAKLSGAATSDNGQARSGKKVGSKARGTAKADPKTKTQSAAAVRAKTGAKTKAKTLAKTARVTDPRSPKQNTVKTPATGKTAGRKTQSKPLGKQAASYEVADSRAVEQIDSTVEGQKSVASEPARLRRQIGLKSLIEKRNQDQNAGATSAKVTPVVETFDESDGPSTLKMTKAERKRAKNAKREARKANRSKKAA